MPSPSDLSDGRGEARQEMTANFKHPHRIDRLRAKIEEEKLDGILISSGENRRYLSGFVSTAGWLFVTKANAVLCTDFRYTEQAGLQAPGYRVDRIGGKLDWMSKLFVEHGAKQVGFEADHITVAQFDRINEAMKDVKDLPSGTQLRPTQGITLGLRAVKDAEEVNLLSRAIQIGDEAFAEVEKTLSPGMTEEEVAWRIEQAVRVRGAEAISFDTIVGSGPNAARPHHRAGSDVLREGQTIVIDMGARYQGYCSDLTRTVVLGKPDSQAKKVYDIVLAAQLAAIEMVRPGMTGAECDGIARKVIQEAGHGDAFGHSLGHGVGLEVHESPGVGPSSPGKLQENMVFTIEPGIYITGWGGVRIEDVVVLENGRARVLSKAPRMKF
ncbi:MAG: aminopeptidase P family protein [Dehalococcoidia bacterium]|nr:aminopeptidase P family protein [Dehalococcoidia bacterium]MSQ34901.1 aminopeptidase P family protein [Dehalococcoidia bacterium]